MDEHIESLATHYAKLFIHKRLTVVTTEVKEIEEPEYETVEIKPVSNSKGRTMGAEYVGVATLSELLGTDLTPLSNNALYQIYSSPIRKR